MLVDELHVVDGHEPVVLVHFLGHADLLFFLEAMPGQGPHGYPAGRHCRVVGCVHLQLSCCWLDN